MDSARSPVRSAERPAGRPWSFWTLAGLLCALTAVPALIAVDARTGRVTGGWSSTSGWTATRFGPLGPADVDLLLRLRRAGLWQAPAGLAARQRATDARIRDLGGQLAGEYARLDEQVRSAAAQLGVGLPNQPDAERQGWLNELAGKRGATFDDTFVLLVRAEHGTVLAAAAAVRAGTRNSLVRPLAQAAIETVARGMTLLEGTGRVDHAALPTPPDPPSPLTDWLSGSLVVPIALGTGLLLGAGIVLGGPVAVRTLRRRERFRNSATSDSDGRPWS